MLSGDFAIGLMTIITGLAIADMVIAYETGHGPDAADPAIAARWIEQGTPYGSDKDPTVVGIKCLPEGRIMEGLIELGNMLVGHIRGGLAHVVVLVGRQPRGPSSARSPPSRLAAQGSVQVTLCRDAASALLGRTHNFGALHHALGLHTSRFEQLVGPAVGYHVAETMHGAYPDRFHSSENFARIVAAGFDGVYLDRVDAFQEFESENPASRNEMIAFVNALAAHAQDELGISAATTARPIQAALTSAAMATSTLRIGSRMACVSYHVPTVLTKEMASIDVLSDGRLTVVEFDERSGQIAAATTRGQLDEVFSDLPSLTPSAPSKELAMP